MINKKVRGCIRDQGQHSKQGPAFRTHTEQLWQQDIPPHRPPRILESGDARTFLREPPTSCKNNVSARLTTRQAQTKIAARQQRATLEGISGVLSTLSQPNLTPQWKQEVNRRIAAHKSRKGGLTEEAPAPAAGEATSRAAQAAARVAARYAKAPTYSEMQAAEARVAVRAAEIATKVAIQAQAVAETALAELHAASVEQPSRGPAVVETIPQAQKNRGSADRTPALESALAQTPVEGSPSAIAPAPIASPEPRYQQPFAVRWDPDMPARSAERRPTPARVQEEFELAAEDWWSPAEISTALRNEPLESVEGEPAHANLIQFPRELVATRKIRPRLAEGYAGTVTEAEGQLSIFEVDPGSVSTTVEAPAASQAAEAPGWSRTEWSGIQLDAHPLEQPQRAGRSTASARSIYLAPVGLRLMAAVVDGALIAASFVLAGFVAAANFQHPPVGKPAELLGVVSLAIIGLVYYGVFFTMGMSTPGMTYAGIGLCTFDSQSPTREQLHRRLGAMCLSLLPFGLGMVWPIFDEDSLSWHDRFSQTYLRKL